MLPPHVVTQLMEQSRADVENEKDREGYGFGV